MRHTITKGDLSEANVKPADLLDRYLELTAEEVPKLLEAGGKDTAGLCPGCQGSKARESFQRMGFFYWECEDCFTLWVTPRPSHEAIINYYRESQAERYWQEVLARTTAAARLDKIIRPRMEWIRDAISEFRPDCTDLTVVYDHQPRDVAAAASSLPSGVLNCRFISPLTGGEDGGEDFCHGHHKVEFDAVAGFEALNRMADPDRLLMNIWDSLRPGGLCFLTLTLSSGFDVMVLGEHARHIVPPDFLNLFSLEGVTALCERRGFECLELSTPGLLDVEHVSEAINSGGGESIPKFIRYLLEKRSGGIQERLQDFLQSEQLSSHARVLLRKPKA